MSKVITGSVYVVKDNIDTDQIIPAQYLNLIPTVKEEYDKLGSYALCGLPDSLYSERYVEDGEMDSKYPIVVGGPQFRGVVVPENMHPSQWGQQSASWFWLKALPAFSSVTA